MQPNQDNTEYNPILFVVCYHNHILEMQDYYHIQESNLGMSTKMISQQTFFHGVDHLDIAVLSYLSECDHRAELE